MARIVFLRVAAPFIAAEYYLAYGGTECSMSMIYWRFSLSTIVGLLEGIG